MAGRGQHVAPSSEPGPLWGGEGSLIPDKQFELPWKDTSNAIKMKISPGA